MKTNAARRLETMNIPYELRDYEPSDEHLPAEEIARRVGLPAEQIFKTLACRGDRSGILLAVVPVDSAIELRALAKLSGDRKCDTVPLEDVQPLTGYARGGVTAIACKRDCPTYVDETLPRFDVIGVSAGMRGAELLVAPADYMRATNARIGPIAKPR